MEFKIGESVALKSVPHREMTVVEVKGNNIYKCITFSAKKQHVADYDGTLLMKYTPPPTVIKLVNRY
jgi:uncharacterized protein YodC (DUF2158 family)